MKKTQKQIVINQLLENNEISRNWCLQNYISRLSAIIYTLEKEGWSFKTANRGGDYVYMIDEYPKDFKPLESPNLKPHEVSTKGLDIFQLRDRLAEQKKVNFINKL